MTGDAIFYADGDGWTVAVRDYRPTLPLRAEVRAGSWGGETTDMEPDNLVDLAAALLAARTALIENTP